jgi:hypothetical protein
VSNDLLQRDAERDRQVMRSTLNVWLWRNRDRQRGRLLGRLPGSGKAGLYGRDQARSGRSSSVTKMTEGAPPLSFRNIKGQRGASSRSAARRPASSTVTKGIGWTEE